MLIDSCAFLPSLLKAQNACIPEPAGCCADKVGLTTNQNFVRDFPVAFDILFENISDQVGSRLKDFAEWMWHSDTITYTKSACYILTLTSAVMCHGWRGGFNLQVSQHLKYSNGCVRHLLRVLASCRATVPFAHNGVAYKRCAQPPRCSGLFLLILILLCQF